MQQPHSRAFIVSLFITAALVACGSPQADDLETPQPTEVPSATPKPTATRTQEVASQDEPRVTDPHPDSWMDMPVVPVVSDTTREIYARGQELGRDPNVFSIIGDCQNVESHFLGAFNDPEEYRLGSQYAYLQDTIDHFAGSFTAERAAVRGGYNVASLMDYNRTNLAHCEWGETPLECEYRLNNPSIAIISLETNFDQKSGETYARYMRQIVEYSIEQGVVPILATKADNLEGDYAINQAIVEVAWEYDVPLWNFWAAVQDLPNGGLEHEEGGDFHLTWARPFFNDPEHMQHGWPVRNLTALQALDAVWRGVNDMEPPASTARADG